MSVGIGIFLIAIGAILSFALQPDLLGNTVDLVLVGYVLMVSGLATTLISVGFLLKRNRSVATSRTSVDNSTGEKVEQRETTSANGGS